MNGFVINLDEIQECARDFTARCGDCDSYVGVVISAPDVWDVALMHELGCAEFARITSGITK